MKTSKSVNNVAQNYNEKLQLAPVVINFKIPKKSLTFDAECTQVGIVFRFHKKLLFLLYCIH